MDNWELEERKKLYELIYQQKQLKNDFKNELKKYMINNNEEISFKDFAIVNKKYKDKGYLKGMISFYECRLDLLEHHYFKSKEEYYSSCVF